jgi:hypothetical protein
MPEGIQVTEQGVFIPRQVYQNFGEIEIIFEENYILIKPRNMTQQYSGFIRPVLKVEEIHEDYELSLQEYSLSHIATADSHFDQVDGLTVWKPTSS